MAKKNSPVVPGVRRLNPTTFVVEHPDRPGNTTKVVVRKGGQLTIGEYTFADAGTAFGLHRKWLRRKIRKALAAFGYRGLSAVPTKPVAKAA